MQKKSLEKIVLKIVYSSLCIVYTAGLVYIFFFARRRWVPFSKRTIHLVPFRDKTEYLQACTIHTRPENVEFYKDLIGNILIFIPFPFLLCYLLAIRSNRKLLLISTITSFCVEAIQYILNIGVADIDDLLLNTLGALIGVLLLHMISLKNTKLSRSHKEILARA
jgi:glycopeptide antibiotics resistance protein